MTNIKPLNMHPYIICPSKALLIFFAFVEFAMQGCALLVKPQINRRFPPVSSIEKKINATCENIRVCDTTKVYDALVTVNKKLFDTVIVKALNDDTKTIKFADQRIDSLTLTDAENEFCFQELILSSNQVVNFNYKRLRNISYSVSASTAPYYSQDTLFINPYFNSVNIKSIKFRGLGFLTRRRVIYNLINGLINDHLDNINGQIKNYYFIIAPRPIDGKAVSSLLNKKPGDLEIEQDAVIKFQKQTPNVSFKIDLDKLQLLLAVNKPITDNNFICPGITVLSNKEKNVLFCDLYNELTTKWAIVENKHFDTFNDTTDNSASVKIRNGFLAENINYSFQGMDFRFRMVKKFSADVPHTGISIPKPSLGCPGVWACMAIPTYCLHCHFARRILNWLPANIPVGSFGGHLNGGGVISCKIGTIHVNDIFSAIAISNSLNFSGNLNYDFNFYGNGIAGIVLSCPVIQFAGTPFVNGRITNPELKVNIEKHNTDTNCIAKINFEPVTYRIGINPSPVVSAFLNVRNYLTCNMTLVTGGFGLGQIVGRLFNLDQPIRIMDAALTGKYDSEYQINSIDYPILFVTQTRYGGIKLKSFWGEKSVNASF